MNKKDIVDFMTPKPRTKPFVPISIAVTPNTRESVGEVYVLDSNGCIWCHGMSSPGWRLWNDTQDEASGGQK